MRGDLSIVDVPTTQTEPEDFDAFWAETLESTRRGPLDLTVTANPTSLTEIDVFDVTFRGFGGTPIRAWLPDPLEENAASAGSAVMFPMVSPRSAHCQ